MFKWKLYWIIVEGAEEDNCFVVAKTKRSAASIEGDDAQAEFVMELPHTFQNKIEREQNDAICNGGKPAWPQHASEDLLRKLGASFFDYNGRGATKIEGKIYETHSVMEVLFSDEWQLIDNVADYQREISKEDDTNRIYRGQADATWIVQSKIDREEIKKLRKQSSVARLNHEKHLLEKFKCYSKRHLSITPKSDWEWLAIARHHGLPTRLLDWTYNPLIALFFAVDTNSGDRDAVVYSYKHNGLIVEESANPFELGSICLFQPKNIYDRIECQESVFTVEPFKRSCKLSELFKRPSPGKAKNICIPAKSIKKIKKELDQLGFSNFKLMPSLDSLCLDLGKTNMKVLDNN